MPVNKKLGLFKLLILGKTLGIEILRESEYVSPLSLLIFKSIYSKFIIRSGGGLNGQFIWESLKKVPGEW